LASRFLVTPAYDSSGTLYDDPDVAYDGALADTVAEWNATDTGIWSATSGGTAGASVPGVADAVIMDANSPSVVINTPINISSLDLQSTYTGTFDNATNDQSITVAGDVTFDGGNVSMGDATWTVSGNWDSKDVTTLDGNASTLVMDGTTKTITLGSSAQRIEDLTVSGTISSTEVSDRTDGSLNITGTGVFTVGPGNKFLFGDSGETVQIQTGGQLTGAGTIQLSTDINFTVQDGTCDIADIEFVGNHGDPALAAGTYTSNILIDDVPTWNFASGTTTINGNLTIEANGATRTIANGTNNPNLTISGNINLDELGGGTINWNKGTGTITHSGAGSGTQAIDWNAETIEDLVVNDAGATKQFTDGFTTDSFTHSAGTLDINGQTITTVAGFTISAGALVTATGFNGSVITVGGAFNANGTSEATKLNLLASAAWTLTVNGAIAKATFVKVKNSDASGGLEIRAVDSDDGPPPATNTNWSFVGGDGIPDVVVHAGKMLGYLNIGRLD